MADPSNLPDTFYCTKPIDFAKAIDTSNLKDKSIIITGGANGIGLGCAQAFAEAGAYVTIFDLNEEKGNEAAAELKGKGYNAQFVKTDTTSWDSQVAGFKSAIAFSPRKTIDIVIPSAGLIGIGNAGDWLKSQIESKPVSGDNVPDPEAPSAAALNVNLNGVFDTTHLALYYFKQTLKPEEQGDKQIIFISSLAGYVTLSQRPDYLASKFGVRGLWKSFRHSKNIVSESGTPRFRTNLIAPTFIKTDMTKSSQSFLPLLGIALGEVEDVVAGVIRIACDDTIEGRAVATVSRDKVPGDRNFDLQDDYEGYDSGRELLNKIVDGTLNNIHLFAVPMPVPKA